MTVQFPTDTKLSVVPLTVQTLGVVVKKPTTKPDVDVAVSAAGVVPSV